MKKYGVLVVLMIAGILGFSGMAQADLNDGLVAYYPFNGNANDESGNENDGVVVDAILSEDRFGLSDSAYSFQGSGYISVNDHTSLDFEGDFSVSFWVQGISTSERVELISKRRICNVDPFFDIRQTVYEVVALEISDGSSNPLVYTDPINDGSWHHLVLLREGNVLKAYTDSILSNENNLDGDYDIINNEPLQFSNGPCVGTDGTTRLNGKLDDIRLYNRALSESEIQELYNEGETYELPENINTYLILTENSVPLYLPKGSYVQTYGSNGTNTLNVEEYARLQCKNFIGENEINIEEASSQFTVYRSGATVYLNSTSGTRIEIPATETSQTLRFADGSLELVISDGNVMLGGQVVDETEQSIDSDVNSSDTSESIF